MSFQANNRVLSLRTLLIIAVILPLLGISTHAVENFLPNNDAFVEDENGGSGGSSGSASASSAVFNTDPQDRPTVRVGNATRNGGSVTNWKTTETADAGDYVSFTVYYHNTGTEPAQNTRVFLDRPMAKTLLFVFLVV
jgi:hypothetical protein